MVSEGPSFEPIMILGGLKRGPSETIEGPSGVIALPRIIMGSQEGPCETIEGGPQGEAVHSRYGRCRYLRYLHGTH